jgi:hypothetical protein
MYTRLIIIIDKLGTQYKIYGNYVISYIYNILCINIYKVMAFKGKNLVCSKIEIDSTILEQVEQFNYLGCELS